MKTENPYVSVIIATLNESKHIERCLDSIKSQTYPFVEIILVDNNSEDNTRDLASKFTSKIFNLPDHKDIDKIKNKRGAQVNLGAEMSQGDILFFPDADMTFDKDLIENAVSKIKTHDALFVPEKISGTGFFRQIRAFERDFYTMTCIDAPRFVNKNIFTSINGFDEKNISFGADDWDLSRKLSTATTRFGLTRSKIHHHESLLHVSTYIKKKLAYSGSINSYIKKWGKNDEIIKKQFGIRYRFLTVFIENGKWKKLLKKPHLAISMYILRGLIGLLYLVKTKKQLNCKRMIYSK